MYYVINTSRCQCQSVEIAFDSTSFQYDVMGCEQVSVYHTMPLELLSILPDGVYYGYYLPRNAHS